MSLRSGACQTDSDPALAFRPWPEVYRRVTSLVAPLAPLGFTDAYQKTKRLKYEVTFFLISQLLADEEDLEARWELAALADRL